MPSKNLSTCIEIYLSTYADYCIALIVINWTPTGCEIFLYTFPFMLFTNNNVSLITQINV